MNQWDVIYEYCIDHPNCTDDACQKTVLITETATIPSINLLGTKFAHAMAPAMDAAASLGRTKRITFQMPIPMSQFIGIMLLALGIGGMIGPVTTPLRLEGSFLLGSLQTQFAVEKQSSLPQLPKSAPVVFMPLTAPDGTTITPVNKDFSIVVPKIGVNAPIIADVNPAKPNEYDAALLEGVAHASTSFFPDQDGTVYLFSHSTNYEWFVKDLNAVFYLMKNLEKGDTIVLFYKGKQYTYILTDKKIVSPSDASYLVPVVGKKNLILQTCWPPGSTTQRLLLFANLVENGGQAI